MNNLRIYYKVLVKKDKTSICGSTRGDYQNQDRNK